MRDVEREKRLLKPYIEPANALVCVSLWAAAYFLHEYDFSQASLQILFVAPGGRSKHLEY